MSQLTLDGARTLIARARSDIRFLKSIPFGAVRTDELNGTAASSRIKEAIDNLTTLCNAIDPDREAAEAKPAEVAQGDGAANGGPTNEVEGASGAGETAPPPST